MRTWWTLNCDKSRLDGDLDYFAGNRSVIDLLPILHAPAGEGHNFSSVPPNAKQHSDSAGGQLYLPPSGTFKVSLE